jgi:hypothetical protein
VGLFAVRTVSYARLRLTEVGSLPTPGHVAGALVAIDLIGIHCLRRGGRARRLAPSAVLRLRRPDGRPSVRLSVRASRRDGTVGAANRNRELLRSANLVHPLWVTRATGTLAGLTEHS